MTFGFKAAICVVLTFLVCSCVTGPDVLDLYIDGKSKEIIDLYEQGEAKERDRTSRDDFYLCQAYLKAKRYDKLNCPLEFTEKYKRADLKRSELFLYAERAHMLIDLGRYHDAAKDAQIAIGLLESDFWGDEKPLAISAYAMAQAYLGNEKEAIAYVKEIEEYKPAMSTFSATSTNISKDEALARVYMALGRYKDVIRVSERSKFDVGVGEVLFGPFAAIGYATNDKKHQAFLMRSREYIPFTFMLAKAYYETLNMEKAEYGFKAVLSFPSISSYGSIHWISLANLGMIRLSQDSPSEAIRLLKKAVDVIEWQRTTISVEASRIGFVGDKQSVYRNLVKVLFKKQRYAEAFEYVERAKARALVDLLASKRQFGDIAAGGQKTAALLTALDKAEMQDVTQLWQVRQDEASVWKPTQRSIAVKERIIATAPQLAALVTVSPPQIKSLQDRLVADETLVEYYGNEATFYAFLVTRDAVQGVSLEGQGLAADVRTFRQQLQDLKSDRYRARAREMYQRLVAPLQGLITTPKVTVVPHGPLHYLPFGALYGNNRFLVDQYELRVLPSASVLVYLNDERTGADTLLAIGNPDLGNSKLALPFAELEAQLIARGHPNARVLLRGQATETALKTHGGSVTTLHLALHGTFDPENPLASGLLLAGDDQNDGRLTVSELYDLSLSADLVTLSACETALGKVAHGDDVVGFTRGFLYAGADSIVSSLWQVDDQATGELMESFYRHMKAHPKGAALRLAQLDLKRSARTAHPYFWAPFQLTGASR